MGLPAAPQVQTTLQHVTKTDSAISGVAMICAMIKTWVSIGKVGP